MRDNIFLIVFILGFVFASCEEADIKVFGTKHELLFEKFFIDAAYPGTEKADSTSVSFFFSPDSQKYIYADLVMHLSGRRLENDLEFSLRVVPEETSATESEYELEEYYKFRAMDYPPEAKVMTDTIHIKMKRSDRLTSMPEGVKLTLAIVATENVGIGQFERSRAKIIMTENAVRPLWWNSEVEAWLLGEYSVKKYKLFLANVDGAIRLNEYLIREEPSEAIKLVREFKKWLMSQEPQVLEENGNVMTVNV